MLGHNKRLERELNDHGGKRAWATVLESDQEWSSSGGVNRSPGQSGSFTIHQRLRLRVEPDGETPFESTVKQVFNDTHGMRVPREGGSVTVIYNPDDHSKLAIDLEGMSVGPGVDRDQATAMDQRATERHKMSEMAPGESARRAEEMRAIALDASLSPEEKRAKIMELSASIGGAPKTMFVGGEAVHSSSAAGPAAAVDALAKLADLRDRGVLTEAEFEAQKAKLLAES